MYLINGALFLNITYLFLVPAFLAAASARDPVIVMVFFTSVYVSNHTATYENSEQSVSV